MTRATGETLTATARDTATKLRTLRVHPTVYVAMVLILLAAILVARAAYFGTFEIDIPFSHDFTAI